jgi:hypothetical protein
VIEVGWVAVWPRASVTLMVKLCFGYLCSSGCGTVSR